jgi:hypothetical protein
MDSRMGESCNKEEGQEKQPEHAGTSHGSSSWNLGEQG